MLFRRNNVHTRRRSAVRSTIQFGVGALEVPNNLTELNDIAAMAGSKPTILLFYRNFLSQIDIASLDAAKSYGAVPLLTWEPFDGTGPTNSAYSLGAIINGDFDTYITEQAVKIRDWGKPLWLRFAHEMNGDWYPWCEGVNGNTPGQYVAAWKHIHGLFTNVGVTNVIWIWSPNVIYEGSIPLSGLYPGDTYVDRIAIDGYNWGIVNNNGWQSPTSVFDATFTEINTITTVKPLTIGETASTELGGDKAAWITDFFTWIKQQPEPFDSFVWFHYNKETDWRINSTQTAADAFKLGIESLGLPPYAAPATAKSHTLTDDFTTQDNSKWTGWSTKASIVNGNLSVEALSSYPGIVSTGTYDMTDNYIMAELVQTPNVSNGSTAAILRVEIDANNTLEMLWENNNLICREKVDGSVSDTLATFDSVTMHWFRISESGGSIAWETSADKATWLTQRLKTTSLIVSEIKVCLLAGNWNNATDPGIALWDNFNIQ